MQLDMSAAAGIGYTSGSQIARRVSEAWGEQNLFCAACESNVLSRSPCNTEATDFSCPRCDRSYQLKAFKRWSESRIPDAGYDAMMRAVRNGATPNLLVMQYTPDWCVHNLVLIPSFFFVESAIEQRKPLAVSARRAGWVGCNILLRAIAPVAKLRIVFDGELCDRTRIREQYAKLQPVSALPPSVRGWALDVLRVVYGLQQESFNLNDVYRFEGALAQLHPANRNVRPKIRQQLQVLRDLNLLEFLGNGQYRLRK